MYRKISNKELSAKAAKLAQLQTEADALNDQISAIKAEITAELDRREAEELTVPGFVIRWTRYMSNRFDSSAFKKAMPELAAQYTKQTEARRFSLAAN